MPINLTFGTSVINLSSDLYWSDEHSWTPVVQAAERSITGAMIIDYGTRIGGRNITLQPIDSDSAWIAKSDLETLKAWASVAGREMTLGIHGSNYQVIFRQLDGAIEATPVVFFSDESAGDWYSVTLRFLEI